MHRPPLNALWTGCCAGCGGLTCDLEKISAVRNWHALSSVNGVRQFVGFIGYYRRFVWDFAGLSEPLVALTRNRVPFVWTGQHQAAFEALKTCLMSAPILRFPTEDGRFILDTDASLLAVGGVLNQLQEDREVVITFASRSLRLSQRRYCTTRREMLAAMVMCMHFRSYLQGAHSLCVRITVHFGGCRSFEIVTGCWLAGTCC